MTLHQRQQHLIQQINQVKDENILIMLEDELSYHFQKKISINLSAYDFNELVALADEPEEKDIVSESKYRKATDKWRTK